MNFKAPLEYFERLFTINRIRWFLEVAMKIVLVFAAVTAATLEV